MYAHPSDIQPKCMPSRGSLSITPRSAHRPPRLFRHLSAQSQAEKNWYKAHASTSLQGPIRPPPFHQYHPCRGSSIGRACGSYNSKEINLKVVGSSPTFGYSYIISSSEQLFFCFFCCCCFPREVKPSWRLPSDHAVSYINTLEAQWNYHYNEV